jgi:D-sedoheptulose 7-phosphate isomerase
MAGVNSHLLIEETIQRHPALHDLREPILRAVEMICDCHKNGGKILVCGNGGSAADAEHIVGELVKEFKLCRALSETDRARLEKINPLLVKKLQCGLAAISLVSQTSLISAVANDTDATMIFAQQVYCYGKPGDILWGISTSGNSRNVLHAMQTAKAFGLQTIGLNGANSGAMDELCDVLLKAPETETYKVQELHLPIYHAICMMIEHQLFAAPEKNNNEN